MNNHFNLWVAIEGSGIMSIDGIRYPFQPGTGFILNPGAQISAEQKVGDCLWNLAIHFLLETTQAVQGGPLVETCHGFQIRDMVTFRALADYGESLNNTNDPVTVSQKSGIGEQLLLLAYKDFREAGQNPMSRKMDELMAHIYRSLGDTINDVDAMARFCGLSRSHFSRLFKQHAGQSPNSFLINTRIMAARNRLRNSSATLETIAHELGYRDVYFFSRQFKQKTGITPNNYRNHA